MLAGGGFAPAPLEGCPHSRLRSSGGTPIAPGGTTARSDAARVAAHGDQQGTGLGRAADARGGEGPGWWCPPAAAGASAPVPERRPIPRQTEDGYHRPGPDPPSHRGRYAYPHRRRGCAAGMATRTPTQPHRPGEWQRAPRVAPITVFV
ncbi:hypothetical protein GCM10009601_40620 [Streptomyces thermospinosisporus]|uniref:Uncharacterized protein n=1 Tax=Streptomyces thermospinosisporus TaxID=161482 RepID=A0ABP4JT03_9ACTN